MDWHISFIALAASKVTSLGVCQIGIVTNSFMLFLHNYIMNIALVDMHFHIFIAMKVLIDKSEYL